MCGFISGQNKNWDTSKIKESLALLNHRGPDSSNFHVQGKMMMGHARLCIVGLDNGTQPLYHDNIWAVVKHPALKDEASSVVYVRVKR